jgi:hypothetical protein
MKYQPSAFANTYYYTKEPTMKTQTMNMFALTNEDLPIISGMALTSAVKTIDELTSKELFDQIKAEQSALGYSVKASSWYSEPMVVVDSTFAYYIDTQPIVRNGFPRHGLSFTAWREDGRWQIQKDY